MALEKTGKTVLVTGGACGIGKAIVSDLAAAGYDVAFTYRTSGAEADALTQSLKQQHASQDFTALEADLGDKQQVDDLADRLTGWPGLYGFVHNAGMTADALAAMLDQQRAEAQMQVNFWAMTRLVKAALRPMMRARRGRIMGIGSITAQLGAQGNAAYAATKGAMASYLKTVAAEVARKGVTANVIAPGYVDTGMMLPYAGGREAVERQIPIGRYVRPDEVAALLRFLMSDDAAAITGSVIPVDGGLSAAVGIRNQV